jgi:hypothetical protein
VRSLRVQLSHTEAEHLLRPIGPARFLIRALRSTALVRIPYRIFELHASHRCGAEQTLIGIDLVEGRLDPLAFTHPPADEDLDDDLAGLLPVSLRPDAAEATAIDSLRRKIFRRGFFAVGQTRIEVHSFNDIAVPYYVGLCSRGGSVHLRVVDALGGKTEGARMRSMLQLWLSS